MDDENDVESTEENFVSEDTRRVSIVFFVAESVDEDAVETGYSI